MEILWRILNEKILVLVLKASKICFLNSWNFGVLSAFFCFGINFWTIVSLMNENKWIWNSTSHLWEWDHCRRDGEQVFLSRFDNSFLNLLLALFFFCLSTCRLADRTDTWNRPLKQMFLLRGEQPGMNSDVKSQKKEKLFVF